MIITLNVFLYNDSCHCLKLELSNVSISNVVLLPFSSLGSENASPKYDCHNENFKQIPSAFSDFSPDIDQENVFLSFLPNPSGAAEQVLGNPLLLFIEFSHPFERNSRNQDQNSELQTATVAHFRYVHSV